MAAVYCELGDRYKSAISLPKYVTYNAEFDEYGHMIFKNRFVSSIVLGADRIWIQDDRGIRYVKHRWDNPDTAPIDMKEFMWIKLTSQSV